MATMTYLIKIGSTDLTPYLNGFKVGRPKLWKDSDRNMAGELKATFLGVYPKIALSFRMTTAAEYAIIANLLDASSFSVSFWDAGTSTYKTATYYAGDFEGDLFNIATQRYNDFTVNLIPFKKTS